MGEISMLRLSQSLCMGHGGINHNLRTCKGRSVRQNGIQERRHLNWYEVNGTVRDIIEAEVGDKLAALNEHHIQSRHPERVRTMDDWITAQQYTRNGTHKEIMHEYVVQLGNKYTGCPYEVQLDSKGRMISTEGKPIPGWDTRHTPAYRDGVITESATCKLLKQVYIEFLRRFKRANPQARVVCAAIHADEHGGVHMHINVIWLSRTKNGIGYGLSYSSAMAQQYKAMYKQVGNTRCDNAMTRWRKDMKLLLKKTAFEFGIEKQHMGNKEPHRSISEYKKWMDDRCSAIDKKERELRLLERRLRDEGLVL